jgi:hypothetical protein
MFNGGELNTAATQFLSHDSNDTATITSDVSGQCHQFQHLLEDKPIH